MSDQVCRKCNRNIEIPRRKYHWLIARGYTQKDAAAEALFGSDANYNPLSCCTVDLHTYVDPTKELIERQEIQLRQKVQERKIILEKIMQETESPHLPIEDLLRKHVQLRENVFIYVTNQERTEGGTFMLADSSFDEGDPSVLTKAFEEDPNIIGRPDVELPEVPPGYEGILPEPGEELDLILNITHQHKQPLKRSKSGFIISDVAPISEEDMTRLNLSEPVTALWSGQIKLIPIYKNINGDIPGVMMLNYRQNEEDRYLQIMPNELDILNAEILEYKSQIQFIDENESVITTDVIVVRKQIPDKIIATKGYYKR